MLNKRPSPRRALIELVCVVALTAAAQRAAGSDGMTVFGKVTALPVADIVRRPASFFDLEGKTVTFTPDGEGRYAVRAGSLEWVETGAVTGPVFDLSGGYRGESTGVSLPFEFPFAGRTWTRVYVNTKGNVSFAAPERTHMEQRKPWSSGTMRSVAAAVDSRSAAGLEAMIAVLWAFYGQTAVSLAASPARVAITWDATRIVPRNHYYEPAGPNEFQVRLYPSGVIEFAYRKVSERDGIVGLFHGTGARGEVLGAATDDSGDVSQANVDIVSAELVDNGSTVIASVTTAAGIPDRVSSGSLSYWFSLDFDGADTRMWAVDVDATGRTTSGQGPSPRAVGYAVRGRTLEMAISKTAWPLLPENRTASWHVTAIWWVPDGTDVTGPSWERLHGEPVNLGEASDRDLSSITETVAGNVFEVFHYPSVTKDSAAVLSSIYERAPAEDELAAVFTDFRFDDLFNTGPGSGPVNAPVQGIGDWQANPPSGSRYGSDSLLSALSGSRYIGGPRWDESGVEDDYEFHGHSYGVRHVAHELIHRWTAHLRFRDPRSGRIERLSDDGCRCHWSEWLHVPERYPVWSGFANEPYSTGSIMGGGVWQDNGDGTFTEQDTGYPRAMGLSDLDLYAMGMIPPEEVRPTFLLRDAVETGTRGIFRATKVPVRIEDIVAAMGPRVPSSSEQRKEFRLGVYLLHEDGRVPRAEWLARTQSVMESVVKYFTLATGGSAATAPPPTAVGPPNDLFSNALTISGPSGRTTGSNIGATTETGERLTGGASAWWQWRPASSGTATIDTAGSTFNTFLGVYTGMEVSALRTLAEDDDAIGLQSRVTLQVTAGTVYRLRVAGYDGDTGNIVLNWNLETVSTSPQPNNDNAFATLIFPQVADGASSDGSFFRTTIALTRKAGGDANCRLILYGMDTDFGSGRGTVFPVTVPGNGFMSFRTTGAGRLQSGYATVGCDRRISGQLTYASYDASGTKYGEATVFPTEVESSSYSMIVDGRDGARLALAIANNTDISRTYELTLRDGAGDTVSTGSVTVPARSNIAQFLNDLISPPPDSGTVYLLEARSSDHSDFSMIGLHVTGVVFSTVPAN